MRLLLVGATMLTAGCGLAAGAPEAAAPGGVAAPSRQQVSELALRADRLRVDLGGPGAEPGLTGTFAGPAAQMLRRELIREQQRHEHLETQVDARAVVHWSATGAAATIVIQSSGRQRWVGGSGASAWDQFVDQWQYTLGWSGAWRVWDAADLPPDQWWPA